MRDLDSYQVFCTLELLKSRQGQDNLKELDCKDNQNDVLCACTDYLKETKLLQQP